MRMFRVPDLLCLNVDALRGRIYALAGRRRSHVVVAAADLGLLQSTDGPSTTGERRGIDAVRAAGG